MFANATFPLNRWLAWKVAADEPTAGTTLDRTTRLAVGGVALAVICCAGPALIAGGALAAVGGFFSNGSVIALGVLLVIVGLLVARSRRGRSCPPGDSWAPQPGESVRRRDR